MPETINLREKLNLIKEQWSPRIIGELNGQHLKLAKLQGDFIWHKHASADELFLVLKGELTLHLRDQDVIVREGEVFIVPRGVEHKPFAEKEVHVMVFEPVGTLNTGNVRNERTIEQPKAL